MIAIDTVIVIAIFIYKLSRSFPEFQYLHLLMDYRFGFAKRSLIGAIVSFGFPAVPVWLVFALGLAVWLVTLVLFLRLFKKTFGFDEANVPLFAFVVGSPFFFKNFMLAIGYFDIYGCLFAIVVLLIPARSFRYVVIAALGSIVLILIHHLHFLLYIPTIGVIVALRYYFVRKVTGLELFGGAVAAAAIAAAFVAAQFYGSVPVPMDQLIAYLKTRTADANFFLNPDALDVWYRPLDDDMWRTRHLFVHNLTRAPVYFVLIALHWPVIKYFTAMIRSLAVAWQRKLVVLAVALVSLGYVVIFVVVFDYARWVSSWAVCMLLIMHAVRQLPAAHVPAPIAADNKRNLWLGWIATIIPRVGIVRPF